MTLALRAGSASDVGRVRSANEDFFAVVDELDLIVVADGMGGHQAGEVASAAAVDTMVDGVRHGRSLDAAIVEANTVVFERASADPDLRGMGTTMTAAQLGGDGTLVIAHVGDSRAYVWRDGWLTQVTADHSLVAELVAAGALTEEEAERDPRRSMITRALGIESDVDVDLYTVTVEPGDRVLLCSDGLTSMVHTEALTDALAGQSDPSAAASALVDAANAAGGVDNITVVVADVVETDTPSPNAAFETTGEVAVIDADNSFVDTIELPVEETDAADPDAAVPDAAPDPASPGAEEVAEEVAEDALPAAAVDEVGVVDEADAPDVPAPEPDPPRRRFGLFGRRSRRAAEGDGPDGGEV